MFDRIEIFYSRTRRALSRTRWSARLMGHAETVSSRDEPGLILIQVDGLGEDVLRKAVEKGQMPFIARLLEQDRHDLHSLYSGLPSTASGFARTKSATMRAERSHIAS